MSKVFFSSEWYDRLDIGQVTNNLDFCQKVAHTCVVDDMTLKIKNQKIV